MCDELPEVLETELEGWGFWQPAGEVPSFGTGALWNKPQGHWAVVRDDLGLGRDQGGKHSVIRLLI